MWLDRINEIVPVGAVTTVSDLVPRFTEYRWPKSSIYARIYETLTNAEKYRMWERVGITGKGVQVWKRLI